MSAIPRSGSLPLPRPAPRKKRSSLHFPGTADPRLAFEGGSGSDAVIDGVRAGLPFATLADTAAQFDIPVDVLAATIGIPVRTLARRKAEGRLRPDESDRLARVARVAVRAAETFEDAGAAGRWLQTALRALGQRTPLSLLDTDLGAVRVEQILGRIDHGVYS